MDATYVSGVHRNLTVYEATTEWSCEQVKEDDDVHIVCEEIHNVCWAILCTLDELLTTSVEDDGDSHSQSDTEHVSGPCFIDVHSGYLYAYL